MVKHNEGWDGNDKTFHDEGYNPFEGYRPKEGWEV